MLCTEAVEQGSDLSIYVVACAKSFAVLLWSELVQPPWFCEYASA